MAYDNINRPTCQGINKHEQLGLAYIPTSLCSNIEHSHVRKTTNIRHHIVANDRQKQ
jgi:hypothetical protein